MTLYIRLQKGYKNMRGIQTMDRQTDRPTDGCSS